MVVQVHTGGTRRVGDELDAYLASLDDPFAGRFVDRKGRPLSTGRAMTLKYMTNYDRIGDTYLGPEGYPTTRVSTVWLCEPQFDSVYPRPQYETMIFSEIEELDGLDVRYFTARRAEAGHRRMVRIVKALVCTKAPVAKRHKTRNRR